MGTMHCIYHQCYRRRLLGCLDSGLGSGLGTENVASNATFLASYLINLRPLDSLLHK